MRSCRVYNVASQGFNFLTDDSCGLNGVDDLLDPGGPGLAGLEEHPAGLVLMPLISSLVRGRIPARRCLPLLPDPLPAGQLLVGAVDWPVLLSGDQLGTVRDTGAACDIGGIQTAS